jgi:hypothetical protein
LNLGKNSTGIEFALRLSQLRAKLILTAEQVKRFQPIFASLGYS